MKTYTCHLQFTEQQYEMDETYGISESEHRRLQIDPENLSFIYNYDYTYEHENSAYVVTTRIINDTRFTGNFVKEGNLLKATIVGGTQVAKDEAKQTNLFNSEAITGQFVLTEEEEGNAFKVTSVELVPAELNRISSILSEGQRFTFQA